MRYKASSVQMRIIYVYKRKIKGGIIPPFIIKR
ncbi:hypothetical protein [Pseudomonas phage vB_Pa-PAC2]